MSRTGDIVGHVPGNAALGQARHGPPKGRLEARVNEPSDEVAMTQKSPKCEVLQVVKLPQCMIQAYDIELHACLNA